MKTMLKVNQEPSLFGTLTLNVVTRVEVKEGVLQIWNEEFCCAAYELSEFSNGLSLEIVEEDE